MTVSENIERLKVIAAQVADLEGFELVNLTYAHESEGWMLRVYIDRLDTPEAVGKGSVTIEECRLFSNHFAGLLEVEDVIPVRYRLEVSSPGVDRPLVKAADYNRFRNQTAMIRTHELIEERNWFKGLLRGLEDDFVVIEMEGRRYRIPLEQISKAHLVVHLGGKEKIKFDKKSNRSPKQVNQIESEVNNGF